jgi:hypothetical protein
MAVMDLTKHSTDQRLDALSRKVDEGFARVETDIRDLRSDFNSLQRTLIGSASAIVVTLIVGFGSSVV